LKLSLANTYIGRSFPQLVRGGRKEGMGEGEKRKEGNQEKKREDWRTGVWEKGKKLLLSST
jgi:hypothetical protein